MKKLSLYILRTEIDRHAFPEVDPKSILICAKANESWLPREMEQSVMTTSTTASTTVSLSNSSGSAQSSTKFSMYTNNSFD